MGFLGVVQSYIDVAAVGFDDCDVVQSFYVIGSVFECVFVPL